MTNDFEPLREVERRWNAASSPWNPAALSEIYHEDAVFFGGRPKNYVGRDRIRDYFDSYRDMFRAAALSLVRQVRVPISDDAEIYQGFGDFAFHLHDGRVTHTTLRTSLVLRHDPAADWRIHMHHFSPPPERPPVPQ